MTRAPGAASCSACVSPRIVPDGETTTSLCARRTAPPLRSAIPTANPKTLARDTDRLGVVRTRAVLVLNEREHNLPSHGRALDSSNRCLLRVGAECDQIESHRTLVGVVASEHRALGLDP